MQGFFKDGPQALVNPSQGERGRAVRNGVDFREDRAVALRVFQIDGVAAC